MSRSPRWRNRRREERQQQAAERAAKPKTHYACGHVSTLTENEHNERAHAGMDGS